MERILALRHEVVALINCGDTRDRSSLVIENLVRDVWRDAEARHPRDARPSKVVKAPTSYARKLVDITFCPAEPLESFLSVRM